MSDTPDKDMPDSTSGSDPIDKAYVQAEAVLSDDDARAARRGRVLAAVAREPATPLAPSSVDLRRPAWRYGRWLAAACVAGLSVFVVIQNYQPVPPRPQTAPTNPSLTPGLRGSPPAAPALASSKPRTVHAAPLRAETPAPPAAAVSLAAPPPPPLAIEPARRAFPAEPVAADSAPPPAPAASSVVVVGERAAPVAAANATGYVSGGAADAQDLARSSAKLSLSPVAAAPPAASPPILSRPIAGLQLDRGVRLRAAAAAGRTIEVEALLDQGAPVDAPDADGDTALMKSIQADQPAVAAILLRRGAGLDRKNHAGESARDMAGASGDPALTHALGLDR